MSDTGSQTIASTRLERRVYQLGSGVGIVPDTVERAGVALATVGDVGAKLNTYGDAPAGTTFQNFGGRVIGNVDIQLVFWGQGMG